MLNKLRQTHIDFLNLVEKEYGQVKQVTRQQVVNICEKHSLDMPWWLLNDHAFRAERGLYNLPSKDGSDLQVFKPAPRTISMNNSQTLRRRLNNAVLPTVPVMNDAAIVTTSQETPIANEMKTGETMNMSGTVVQVQENLVPVKAPGYVKFGHFDDLLSIVKSGKFYPTYITGLSGNGKTLMVEQICATAKRELIRVNITAETDEDDLIGGFRLINGQTVWHNGPVVMAMERGAVLLLDEVDLGSIKLMCLQPVLEGKAIFLKKINKVVRPTVGFTVLATANTKGRGSEDGKFIGTNVMNEAFLERFSITMDQEYPPLATERKILRNVLEANGSQDEEYVENLIKWADIVRKTYYDNGVSDIISTRRLVHICEAFTIFGRNRMKAIELCLNRFDKDTKTSFLELYRVATTPAAEPTPDTTEIDNIYSVVMENSGETVINVIKEIRSQVGLTLKEVKEMTEAAASSTMPVVIKAYENQGEADALAAALHTAGAKVSVVINKKKGPTIGDIAGLKIITDAEGKKFVEINGVNVDISELDADMIKTLGEALNTK